MKKRAIFATLAIFVAACGGAAQSPPAASSPAAPASGPALAPNADESKSPPPPPPMPTTAPRAVVQPGDAGSERERARADLEEAAHELDASMSQCAAACRALGSMERAAGRLCDLAAQGGSDDDKASCDDARAKLRAARERVRRTCTVCAGGPTLDPGAPP